ncbi:hypothetical protein A7982_12907 [Minicystis rosea]|nr:hypothetical protein A7982_12907 [Minicystis rosea]
MPLARRHHTCSAARSGGGRRGASRPRRSTGAGARSAACAGAGAAAAGHRIAPLRRARGAAPSSATAHRNRRGDTDTQNRQERPPTDVVHDPSFLERWRSGGTRASNGSWQLRNRPCRDRAHTWQDALSSYQPSNRSIDEPSRNEERSIGFRPDAILLSPFSATADRRARRGAAAPVGTRQHGARGGAPRR